MADEWWPDVATDTPASRAMAVPPGSFSGSGTRGPMSLEEETERQLVRMKALKEAKRKLSSEAFSPFTFPDDFEAEMAEPLPEVKWTIEGLHIVGGNSTIIAGFKAGKTTMMHSLIRSLVDGKPFLGEHGIREIDGRLLYLNFEVPQNVAREDLARAGFVNKKKLTHWPMRGLHFDLMDDIRAEWFVKELKRLDIEILIIDPYSGAYYGNENDNSEATAFTKRLDEIKLQAGVKDLFMPVHTGGGEVEFGAERARGATKIDDWADHRWVLTRLKEEGTRYFKAEGRGGMNFDKERALAYDLVKNELRYSTEIKGTRRSATKDRLEGEVLAFVKANPGKSRNEIKAAITGDEKTIAAILKSYTAAGKIRIEVGPNRSHLHYPATAVVGLEDI